MSIAAATSRPGNLSNLQDIALRKMAGVSSSGTSDMIALDFESADEADASLTRLMEQAAQAMRAGGLTTQDFLDALPQARTNVYERAFSPAFRQELERLSASGSSDSHGD
jgi:hypothetical protein